MVIRVTYFGVGMGKMNFFLTCLAVLAAILAAHFARKSYDLQAKVEQYTQQRFSFITEISSESLIIRSIGDQFVRPRNLTVTPVFKRSSHQLDTQGEQVSIAVQDHQIFIETKRVEIPKIIETICRDMENKKLCKEFELRSLEVSFSVNGTRDTDILDF